MKVAVSIPDDVFNAAEQTSARMRVSRSRFYADALRAHLRAQSGEEITRRLNKVYTGEASALDAEAEAASLEILRQETW